MYYDERWIQKQETGFSKWLNFILTPDDVDDGGDGLSPVSIPGKIDVAKVWKACSSATKVPRAPTKETLSFRTYTVRKELNRLRRQAFALWESPSMAAIIERLELEIEKQALVIRKDKSLNMDIGMKKQFLELLLNYNPMWLKVGCEIVFGEVLPYAGNDVVGLSRFIVTRVLNNPEIQSEFAHPTVPHRYGPGYEEALKKFTLKKFLQLVYFLDKAKDIKLIKHDPCLFCKDAKVKVKFKIVSGIYKDETDKIFLFSIDFQGNIGLIFERVSVRSRRYHETLKLSWLFCIASTNSSRRIRLCCHEFRHRPQGRSPSHVRMINIYK